MRESRIIHHEVEYTPEQQERIRFLVNGFKSGMENDKIVAYHGTSLDVLKGVIKNGKLQGGIGGHEIHERNILPPQLSVVLKDSAVESGWLKRHADDPALRFASEYAEGLSRAHATAAYLGFEPTDERFRGAFHGGGDRVALIESGVVTEEDLTDAITQAKKYNGVVLGFHKDVLKDFKIRARGKHHEKGEEVIICPDGINYKYIIGLEPEGQIEWNFFENLEKNFF
jgi:hypothetical protein